MRYTLMPGASTTVQVAAVGATTVAVPQNAFYMYISSASKLRVSVDGFTAASDTTGLFVPSESTALLAVRGQATVSVYFFTALTNATIQFMGG